MKALIQELGKLVASGQYLSAAISRFPKAFPRMVGAMIRVGEESGGLALCLDRLADWLEEESSLIAKARAAFTYPCFVLSSALTMTLILFCSVMPGFVEIFEDLGGQLPLLTQLLILTTKLLTNPVAWLLFLLACAGSIKAFVEFLKTENGWYNFYRVVLLLPLIGKTVQLLAVARFCGAMSTMLTAGLSLPLSIKLSCQASGSPLLKEESTFIIQALSEGDYLSHYMKERPDIYPHELSQIVEVGEESAALGELLSHSSKLYQEDVSRRFEGLAAALEPLMLLVASLVVGTVLMGIFMPLYGMVGNLGV